ncbi:FkbM family methyltransferase [Helicobacter kayseriensis]|uniref:FkbM family methyltransferase n=1 Tax=Helicobacter kayseriensis TaxID=2905877 RepID=UPI001E3E04BF|nr:FkbM family methyltransferase [Helicobacter kayseriensis]MCE3046736.1 FkbM family methyltransferase [Helicobacter kayseriensis]MCE3047962.1 FkbM family methyltransferase [Helicobacter kayseriensis]
MKHILKKIPFLKSSYIHCKNLFALYATKSYSQEGEDLLLRRIFEQQKDGFYVDIGAHHPFRFSNTFLFYKRGWKGINIDAMPNSMKLFKRFRPRDTNLEIPVGKSGETLEYFSFNEPALNTFNPNIAAKVQKNPHFKLLKTYSMQITSLAEILQQYLPQGQKIDFMSIDVEGLDLEVLQSNDWDTYRPKYLLVEALGGGDYEKILTSPLYLYLSSHHYKLFAKTFNTLFFADQKE